MRNFRLTLLLALASTALFFACGKDTIEISTDVDCATATYSGKIQNLVETRCNTAGCHDAGSGNGDYTTYDLLKAEVDGGKIASEVLDKQSMPQGSSLTSTQLGEIQCWLDAGAPNN